MTSTGSIAAVTAALSQLPPSESIPEEERLQLLEALDKTRAAMEPPIMSVMNFCFAHQGIVGIRVAIEMGIFDALAAGGRSPQTIEQLAEKTQGDEKLLRALSETTPVRLRILRLLRTKNLVVETDDHTYQPLPLALGFATGSPLVEAIKHFYANMKASTSLNEYFKTNGYRNPDDAHGAPFQFAYNTKDHHFDWLQKNPEDQHAFNVVMGLNRQVEGVQWYDFYPVQDKLQVSPDRVRLVDVGGGLGHDVTGFKERFPDMPGRLVVEDLPVVIQDIVAPLADGVEAVGCDMFREQPVQGAKAYYMRTVLHDWPDRQALQALARIREAMAEDSVLLINENTLPERDASSFSVALDILMMEVYASLERTEKQWIELLEQAGFKVVKVWRTEFQGVGSNALFEAVPV
ncbi:S-adenosyl-L-methionine-dependent methyltransferase [Penicillium capsulatum]|uniref:S-adenosyl-L-methionine-dependent methyltransferase n=1 Tax=Penicillium capsulatum TaxID=69766 RepID=A0A9W9LXT4_9EURO|nr:S-adenosyl-L-methionine-dependent methyltransferase [Penicillium capsulatum]KAJ6121599.1 S-adenosyl-L-methionine-dependent methyltransferase [Penicillium capsulatum]